MSPETPKDLPTPAQQGFADYGEWRQDAVGHLNKMSEAARAMGVTVRCSNRPPPALAHDGSMAKDQKTHNVTEADLL